MKGYRTPRRRHEEQSIMYQSKPYATMPRMSPMPKRPRYHTTPTARMTPRNLLQTESNDRYIPSRRKMNIEVCRRSLALFLDENKENKKKNTLQKEFQRRMMSSLCNIPVDTLNADCEPSGFLSFGSNKKQKQAFGDSENDTSWFLEKPDSHDTLRTVLSRNNRDNTANANFLKMVHRKIDNKPFKMFSTDILDDFYINHISWGANNIVAIACVNDVFFWNAVSGDVQHFTTDEPGNYITSVAWLPISSAKVIAIGMNDSSVCLYDAEKQIQVRKFSGHYGRVASLAWCGLTLASGSFDRSILQHDIRCPRPVHSYEGHDSEICNLKWNQDSSTLASGSNDNTVCIWDASMPGQRGRNKTFGTSSARLRLTDHTAAVKALDWCPLKRNLLASGGGNTDQTIKFWDTCSGKLKNSIHTGSQVSSIVWSKDAHELCTSHGSDKNQLKLWKYPTMELFKELDSHDDRVLGMEISPDGSSVVSVSADDTVRFWNVFGKRRNNRGNALGGNLSFGMPSIR